MSFRAPVKLGDTLTVKLEVLEKQDKRRLVTLDCKVFNQDKRCVAKGQTKVIASETAISVTLA